MSLSLLLACIAEQRRETVAIAEPDATLHLPLHEGREILVVGAGERVGDHIRKLLDAPAPTLVDPHLETMQAEAIRKAAAAYVGEPWTLPGQPAVRGRVVEQAKGPNRATRRGRR
jgi:hypothetical protein